MTRRVNVLFTNWRAGWNGYGLRDILASGCWMDAASVRVKSIERKSKELLARGQIIAEDQPSNLLLSPPRVLLLQKMVVVRTHVCLSFFSPSLHWVLDSKDQQQHASVVEQTDKIETTGIIMPVLQICLSAQITNYFWTFWSSPLSSSRSLPAEQAIGKEPSCFAILHTRLFSEFIAQRKVHVEKVAIAIKNKQIVELVGSITLASYILGYKLLWRCSNDDAKTWPYSLLALPLDVIEPRDHNDRKL